MTTRPPLPLIWTLCIFVAACAGFGNAPAVHAVYGQKTVVKQGVPVHFPHLTLTLQGVRSVHLAPLGRDVAVEDFRIDGGGESKVATYSPGTGDLGPVYFTLDGKRYALERRVSDKLGRLSPDELVLTAD